MPASPTLITRSASNNNNNNNINKNRTGRAHHQRRAYQQHHIEELAVLDPVLYLELKTREHQLEQMRAEIELASKQRRHKHASRMLHAQYKQKQAARQTISKWLRHHINRRRTTHRTKQHIKLRNHCQGTSNYANNIKATRPPKQYVPSKQHITKPTIKSRPVWNRGQQLPKRKRRQSNRRPRPRNRPPKHLRSFNKSSSPILNHHPPNHLNNIEQATDATPKPSPTASSRYSSVPSTDWVSHNNKVQSSDILPLCVWAAQTTVFNNLHKLGRCESSYVYPKTPERAARILQNWYRRTKQRMIETESTHVIQHWYRRIKQRQLVTNNNSACIIQHWYRRISHKMATTKAASNIQQWSRHNNLDIQCNDNDDHTDDNTSQVLRDLLIQQEQLLKYVREDMDRQIQLNTMLRDKVNSLKWDTYPSILEDTSPKPSSANLSYTDND